MVPEHALLSERHAERIAYDAIQAENFTQCLIRRNIDTSRKVFGPGQEEITVRGEDIYKAWAKFLAQEHAQEDLCCLAYVANRLASLYTRWLRTRYTKRYRYLKSSEEIIWLKNIALFTVIMRIMENKYNQNRFVDKTVSIKMSNIMLLRDFNSAIAKEVNHGIKDSDRAVELIHQACAEFHEKIIARLPVDDEPLPALPYGVPDPLVLLVEGSDEGEGA